MIRLVGFILLCMVAAQAMADQGARTTVRARLEPAGPVVVGQPVQLTLEVLVTTWFLRAPDFPALDIPGALVTVPDEQSIHLTEQINGTTWFGLTRTYRIVPMEPGKFAIPPLQIGLSPGLAPKPVTVWSPSRVFSAHVPAGAEGVAVFLATNRLHLAQGFDHPLSGLKVGDALTRTITLTADDTQAMFLPPITFPQVEGLAVYHHPPVVDNVLKERKGFVGGRRVETVTYIIQKPGTHELPAITIQWWDLRAGTLREHVVAPIRFDAAPDPTYRPEVAPPSDTEDSVPSPPPTKVMQFLILSGVAAVTIIAGRLLWPRLQRYRTAMVARRIEQHTQYEASEQAAFAKLEASLRCGHDVDSIRWLYHWLDRCGPRIERPALVEQAVMVVHDDEFKNAMEELLDRRFTIPAHSSTGHPGSSLKDRLQQIRSRLISRERPNARRADLMPLNPE